MKARRRRECGRGPVQTSSYYSRNRMPSVTYTNIHTFILSLSVVVLQFLLLPEPVFLSVCAVVNPGCCGLRVWLRVQADVLISSEVLSFFTTQQYDNPLSFHRVTFCHTLQTTLAGVPEPSVNTHLSPRLLYESCSNAVTLRAVTLAPTADTFICYQPSTHIYTKTIYFVCVF